MKLFYDQSEIGTITDEFIHQGTWFGTFREMDGTEHPRVHEFIVFTDRWNERLQTGDDPDPDEFQQRFGDLMSSGRWSVVDASGAVTSIETPLFTGDEISWITTECPTTNPNPQ